MHQDHQYIEALRRNDPHMIREIYRQHAGAVQRWIQSRGGTLEEARDIFQDALIALFEKAQQADFVLSCPLGALLHVICSRKYIDRLRQKNKDTGVRNEEERRYTETYDRDALTIAEEAVAAQEQQQLLANTFVQLSELCRRLLTLLSNGMTPKDAAAALEMNGVDTLYRRKNACTERWRELVLARA